MDVQGVVWLTDDSGTKWGTEALWGPIREHGGRLLYRGLRKVSFYFIRRPFLIRALRDM
jgi:hypothetical protein